MDINSLKSIRKIRGYSQKEVAEILNVTQGTVSSWEAGRYEPDNNSLQKLADLYGVSTDVILGRESDHLELREDTFFEFPKTTENQEVMIPLVISIRNLGKPNNLIKYIPIPTSYVTKYGKNIVSIMAAGTSMTPTLSPGNYLICIPGKAWEDNHIAVIDINDGETIKRIQRTDDGGFDLIPDNKDFSVMHLTPAEVDKYNVRVLARIVRSISPEL